MKLGAQCSGNGKYKASFQGNMFSYSLNPAVAWILRNLLPGVRSSTIFHFASEFSFSKESPKELDVGRQKERPTNPKKPNPFSSWHW